MTLDCVSLSSHGSCELETQILISECRRRRNVDGRDTGDDHVRGASYWKTRDKVVSDVSKIHFFT